LLRIINRTDIKNQAINKTEGLVNDKANKFLNAFGAGRSEVSINGMNTSRLNYSIKTSSASRTCDFFEYSRGLVVLLGRLWIVLLVRLAEV
jgi:hypothetical protein